MKPSTLIAVLVVILLVGVVIILWVSGAFETTAPSLPIAEEQPITSTVATTAEPLPVAGFTEQQPVTSTVTTSIEPAVTHYTVQPGDTLWSIAKKFYDNDGTKYKLIEDANKAKIPDPNRIKPGIEIVVPKDVGTSEERVRETIMQPPGRETEPLQDKRSGPSDYALRTSEGQYYTIKKGDTLQGIARKFYGSASKDTIIWEANRDKLPTKGTTLKIGWKLFIPKSTPSPKTSGSPTSPKTTDNVPVGVGE